MSKKKQGKSRGRIKKNKTVAIDGLMPKANAFLQKGDLKQAALLLKKVLGRTPAHVNANHLLGVIHLQENHSDTALQYMTKALAGAPQNAMILNNIGLAHKKLGQLDQAWIHFRRVLENNPDHIDAHINVAALLDKTGKADEAVEHYLTVLRFDPGHCVAQAALAKYFQENNDHANAAKLFEAALKVAPDNSDIHANYAIVQRELAHFNKAIAHFKKAIDLDCNNVQARLNYASLLSQIGEFEQSLEQSNWVLKRDPLNEQANSNLLFAVNYHPYLTAKEIFSYYQAWEVKAILPVAKPNPPPCSDISGERRLKIGYVSPDFREHAVRHFLTPVLENHDHDAFEIFAYAELEIVDHVSLRAKRMVDQWLETKGLSDEDLEARIRADKIDVLVDLAGHTRSNRLKVFAHKPAPIQASWMIGYGYTTGLTAIDYFLADNIIVPDGYEDLFSEKVYKLPKHSFCYRPAYDTPAVVPSPALRNGHITFGSLSRTIRLNDLVVALWAKILQKVPMAILRLDNKPFAEEETQQLFKERFGQHGIAEDRLTFTYSQPHWQAYQQIDIALDPFPHNAGTSTLESLWMGAPVVTLAGRPSLGRIGATSLKAVEMDEWIAATEEEYLEIAVAAAQDVTLLNEIRQGLRQRMQNSPLMDEEGFIRELEDAYRTMWKSCCVGGGVSSLRNNQSLAGSPGMLR